MTYDAASTPLKAGTHEFLDLVPYKYFYYVFIIHCKAFNCIQRPSTPTLLKIPLLTPLYYNPTL